LSKIEFFRYVNWWNMMETGFGLVLGAVLALGLWINRRHIALDDRPAHVTLSPTAEISLLVIHAILLISSEFLRLPGAAGIVSQYTNYGLIMCVIPMIGIVGGRLWPYVLLLPMLAAPICGKQMRALVYGDQMQYSIPVGWMVFVMIPIGVTLIVSSWLICRSQDQQKADRFSMAALSVNTLLYLALNTYFFDFAWPWREWTARTPNQSLFGIFSIAILATIFTKYFRSPPR
jgi:hypothetical protein